MLYVCHYFDTSSDFFIIHFQFSLQSYHLIVVWQFISCLHTNIFFYLYRIVCTDKHIVCMLCTYKIVLVVTTLIENMLWTFFSLSDWQHSNLFYLIFCINNQEKSSGISFSSLISFISINLNRILWNENPFMFYLCSIIHIHRYNVGLN